MPNSLEQMNNIRVKQKYPIPIRYIFTVLSNDQMFEIFIVPICNL